MKTLFNQSSKEDNSKEKSILMQYSHIGIQFAVSFALPVFGGLYLDQKWWALSPLGVILGAFIGFGLAFYQLIKNAKEMERRLEEIEKENKGEK